MAIGTDLKKPLSVGLFVKKRKEMAVMSLQKNPLKESEPKPDPIDPPDDQPPVELPGNPVDQPNV